MPLNKKRTLFYTKVFSLTFTFFISYPKSATYFKTSAVSNDSIPWIF